MWQKACFCLTKDQVCFLKRQLAQLLLYQLNWPQILELGYYPAVWLNTPFATFATAASLGSVRKYTR